MKTRFLDILRIIFISPECLIFIALLVAYLVKPNWYIFMGEILLKENASLFEIVKFGPVALAIYNFVLGMKIRFPKNDNKILINWPMYSALKDRVLFSSILSGFLAILMTISLLFKDIFSIQKFGFLLVEGFGLIVTIFITLYLAHINVRELLEKYGH